MEVRQSKRQFPALRRRGRFSQQFGPIVAYVSDVGVGFEHLHFIRFERPKEVEGEAFGFFAVEPAVVVARVEDDGHAGMDPAHEFVWLRW